MASMALVAAQPSWVSCRGRKAPWSEDEIKSAAQRLVDTMPAAAKDVIASPDWKKKGGGAIVTMKDEVGWTPTRSDIKNNSILLEVFLHHSPAKVPSGFWFADILLEADEMLDSKFLCPGKSRPEKMLQAVGEGGKQTPR